MDETSTPRWRVLIYSRASMRIYLVRHGESQGNVDASLYGEMADHAIPLSDAGHEQVLRDFRTIVPDIQKNLGALGVPGVFIELEPHVKGGGQFGGVSGVDGFGVACRSLCNLLDYLGYTYHLSGYEDLYKRD